MIIQVYSNEREPEFYQICISGNKYSVLIISSLN